MEIDQYQLKINGIITLREPLKFGKDYTITVQATVVKDENFDNQDGQFTKRYIVKVDQSVDVHID